MALRFSARSRLPTVVVRTRAFPSPLVLPIRTYATPGRPKSVVGEPSRPVKRAVKNAAAKPRDGTSAAEKKVAAKQRKPASTRAVSPEQAAKRQEEATKKAARDAARKEKAAQRKIATKKKTKLEDLKATALPDAPKKKIYASAFQVYWAEYVKRRTSERVSDALKDAAADWKQLSAADIEHYNHLKRTANEAAAAEYKRWTEAHSPNDIRLANLARAQLRRQNASQKRKWAELPDERRPKRPHSAFLSFSVDRQNSGDFANIKLSERAKLIGQEWKALNHNEKEKYNRLYLQDQQRYLEEHAEVYGRDAIPKRSAVAAAAA